MWCKGNATGTRSVSLLMVSAFVYNFYVFASMHMCWKCGLHLHGDRGKKNTLLGWLVKPELVACWLPIVSEIKASVILGSLPPDFREIFVDVVDGNPGVCVKKFEKKVKKQNGMQLQITFTGKQVSYSPSVHLDIILFFPTANIFFIITQHMSTAQAIKNR